MNDIQLKAYFAAVGLDLKVFMQQAFSTIYPGKDFHDNWHVDAIVYHLEQCIRGETPRLIINMPPRHLKSFIASVVLPAFILGRDPSAKIICISYSDDLARVLARDFRRIVDSAWYQKVFPQVRILKSTETEFVTDQGGFRYATSVGGTLTGRGGDFIIIDDPIKPDDTMSEKVRNSTNEWYKSTLLSRLDDKKHSVLILVMQRLHVNDLTGFVEGSGGFKKLFDEHGHRLLPSHSQKKSKRFRYYVSETLVTSNRANAPNGIRLPAQEIETLVINSLCDWLSDTSAVLDSLGRIDHSAVQGVLIQAQQVISELENHSENRYQIVQKLVSRVTIANREVRIALSPTTLFVANAASTTEFIPAHIELTIPAQIRRCGLAMRLIIQGQNAPQRQAPDQGLIQLIAKSHDWFGRLTSGKAKSVQEIADVEGVTSSYVTRVVYRSFLAPDIVQAILEGTQPATLTLDKLKQNLPLPIDWNEQRKLFGFAPTT